MSASQRVSPFPTPARKRNVDHVDVGMLKVEHNTPLPTGSRASAGSKYDAVFSAMKPGSCVVCEPGEVNMLASSLRKHIERKKWPFVVRSKSRCEDGHARVWMVKK